MDSSFWQSVDGAVVIPYCIDETLKKKKQKKSKQALSVSLLHTPPASLRHKTIKPTFTFFPGPLSCPFCRGAGKQCLVSIKAARRGSDVFNFNVQPEKNPSEPKQTVFMISTSQHSIILLPVSDRHSQPLPREHLWDGDTAPVPWQLPWARRGSDPPLWVPELTLPSHGSLSAERDVHFSAHQINLLAPLSV